MQTNSKQNLQIIMRKLSAILIIFTVTINVIVCAPAQQQQQQQQASSQVPQMQVATNKPNPPTTSTPKASTPSSANGKLNSAASNANGSPSIVNLKNLASIGAASGSETSGNNNNNNRDSYSDLDAFDGKNPFSDDSLWQIPVHLVRDSSAAEFPGADNMAKSASETSGLDEGDYVDEPTSNGQQAGIANLPQSSSSSSPTIISASTDLKTAAGYHYPSSHGHHGYGHDSGHHGGGNHYGAGDHYGKYFQYASVPYPNAWEFGYRRGNPYHTIERYEHGKGPHFQTKVKWSDKHGGYGVHVWDYNHDDHHSHHYGGGEHYDSHGPSHHQGGHYEGGHHYGGGHHH